MLKKMIIGMALMSATAFASSPTTIQTVQLQLLADPNGLTLYTFSPDSEGSSQCYERCAELWPPVRVTQSVKEGLFTSFFRKDGTLQLQYRGKPLYRWVRDMAPGEFSGYQLEGFGGS